jgi:glucosylceramidase
VGIDHLMSRPSSSLIAVLGLVLSASACAGGANSQGTGGSGDSGGSGSGTAGTGAAGDSSGSAGSVGQTGGTAAGGSVGGVGQTGDSGSTGNAGDAGSSGSGGVSATGGSAAGATGGTTSSTGGTIATGRGGTLGTAGRGGTGGGAAGSGGTPAATSALVTSASNAFWKTGTWTESTATATVTVNDATSYQTWEGFGGAFNEKGWSYLTSQQMKDQAIQLLFGKDGCNFAWGRIPIGASDYAMDRYSLNETSGDTSMAMFSIDRDKMRLIPYIKAAQAVKSNIRFWASPWSPPTWMKTGPYNPNTGASHSNFDGGVMKSDDATLKAFALYLVKFVQAYAGQGINVEVVSPQNEPNYQQNYPSCHWDSATFVSFVGKYLGPALTSASLTTKVLDGTLSNPSGDADIGQMVLKDATAKGFVKAIGVQWGMADSGPVGTLKGLAGTIPLWLSETKCGGSIGSTAPAPNDFNYGRDTWGYITAAIKNGLTAYSAWNMVLDKGGLGIDDTRKWPQNALLVADSGTVTATPAYYVFRHFSQFVDPGAKRIDATGGDAIGFKNPDGSLVAIMFNSGSANNSYVVSIGGKKLQFAMPASGWATIKYAP